MVSASSCVPSASTKLSSAFPMTSESAFPLEIYEHILGFVAQDINICLWKRTLASASLVCHGWHPRSRALLFRVMRFVMSDEETLRRYRDHLAVAPYLAAYVEEVRILHRPDDSRTLEAFPRWLAIYLPRLRAVFVMLQDPFPLNMHRFFCLPGARIRSVETLEYDFICLRNTSELEGLLFPYPNARVLTLHLVQWIDYTERWQGKGLPRPLKKPLALNELRIMLDGTGQTYIHIVNRLGYEYLLQACRLTLSKLLLNIVPMRVLILQFQEEYPLNAIDFPHLDTLQLEIFQTPETITSIKDKERGPITTYAEILTMIPRLLRRISAHWLRILELRFSAPDINQNPDAFLKYLNAIRGPMEEMIFDSCFPNLKAITFDLGSGIDVSLWQTRIPKCFPKIEGVVSVQVLPHNNMSEDIRSNRQIEFYYY